MQTFALLALGFLSTGCISKPHNHHYHHKDMTESKEMIFTSYPYQKPNDWCLSYSTYGRLYFNLHNICRQNNRIINAEKSAERSAIHEKIFNRLELTPKDITTVCIQSDDMKKLNATEKYDFMNDDDIVVICDNMKYLNKLDDLVMFVSHFPREVRRGVIPEGQLSHEIKREQIRHNLLENPAIATHLLLRSKSLKAIPVGIQILF